MIDADIAMHTARLATEVVGNVRNPPVVPPRRGRFAPSPTGWLHLGHAQCCLLAWLQMRNCGGAFVLRVENLDPPRDRLGAEAAITEDLRWLGFDWDEGPDIGGEHGPYRQIDRFDRYDAAIVALAPRLFPCTCTRRDVEDAVGAREGELPYPGTCRLGPSRSGAPASLRFRVDPVVVPWVDGVLGPMEQDPSVICGDFIVRSKGGGHVYQLAVVVDDIAMGITDVLRGEDLVDSTSRQVLLHRALGAEPPRFAHIPLRRDGDGQRLAKSRGSLAIRELRAAGERPEVLIGTIAFELGLQGRPDPLLPRDLIGAQGPWSALARPAPTPEP